MTVSSLAVSPKDFLETKRISPYITRFMVKVFYLGLTRKNFIIDRKAAEKIAGTLRGSCVVGRFLQNEGDYGDHGISYKKVPFQDTYEQVVKTVPYGFVDLNAPIWFQDFKERDDDGKEIVRTYCCTEAIIWTGLFPESKTLQKGENNQSIEMPGTEIEGEWAKVKKNQDPILIIHDAAIAKLCILGKNVEPCYEGSKFENMKCSLNNEKELEEYMTKCLKNIKEDLRMSNILNENDVVEVEENLQEKADNEPTLVDTDVNCQNKKSKKNNDSNDDENTISTPEEPKEDENEDSNEDSNEENGSEGNLEEKSDDQNDAGNSDNEPSESNETDDSNNSDETGDNSNDDVSASLAETLKTVVEGFNCTLKTVTSTIESLVERVSTLEKNNLNCSLVEEKNASAQKMGEPKEKSQDALQEYMKDIVLSMKDDYVFCSNEKDEDLLIALNEANKNQD